MADESVEDPRGPDYGEANYIRKGRPMFGKIWTYEEIMNAERPNGFRRGPVHEHAETPTPANWPTDTKVDKGTWVFWLPDGWMQGIRTHTVSGKVLKCYFSPEGKRFWHKKCIEKFLNVTLESREPPPPKEDSDEGHKSRVRYVTDPDAIPNWPEEEWWPKDFKAAYRQLPSGLHPIFIPPGVEGKFLYQKHMVAPYLAGDRTKYRLTDMEGSTTMEEKTAIAADKPANKKRKREVAHYADVTDYESQQLTVTVASGDMATKCVDSLKALHFPFSVEVIRLDGAGAHPYVQALRGFYYDRQHTHDGRPFYQKLQLISSAIPRVACSGVYMYWRKEKNRWELGTLQPGKGCVAFCDGDSPSPVKCMAPWRVLRENFGKEPSQSSETPSSGQGAGSQHLALESSEQRQESTPAAKSSKKQKKQLLENETDGAKDASAKVLVGAQDEKESATDASAKDGAKDASRKPAGDQAQSVSAKAPDGAQDEEEYSLADGRKIKWDGVWHTHKIWSYEEIISSSRRGEDFDAKPAHWPDDPSIEICPGKWQDWLPADWGQCRKLEATTGNMLTMYVSPLGKLAPKKADVEKIVGKIPSAEKVPDWRDWLPRDWKISYRSKGTGCVACFVSPNGKRFLMSRTNVEKCISEGKVNQSGGILRIQGS